MRPLFIVGLTAAMLLAPCTASAKIASAFGIVVQRCIILENKDHTQTTGVNVVYYNSHETPATEVDFLVQYHGKSYTLTDRGSFTHNAQINHNLTERTRWCGLARRRSRALHSGTGALRNGKSAAVTETSA